MLTEHDIDRLGFAMRRWLTPEMRERLPDILAGLRGMKGELGPEVEELVVQTGEVLGEVLGEVNADER